MGDGCLDLIKLCVDVLKKLRRREDAVLHKQQMVERQRELKRQMRHEEAAREKAMREQMRQAEILEEQILQAKIDKEESLGRKLREMLEKQEAKKDDEASATAST